MKPYRISLSRMDFLLSPSFGELVSRLDRWCQPGTPSERLNDLVRPGKVQSLFKSNSVVFFIGFYCFFKPRRDQLPPVLGHDEPEVFPGRSLKLIIGKIFRRSPRNHPAKLIEVHTELAEQFPIGAKLKKIFGAIGLDRKRPVPPTGFFKCHFGLGKQRFELVHLLRGCITPFPFSQAAVCPSRRW